MSSGVHRIRLELLRAGPPHNQLLSPLTDYLGLCGDHGATVVKVPWEHRQFMRRLEQLRYPERGQVTPERQALRQARLEEMAVEIARILGAVPGLAASRAEASDADSLTHLEIVHSAAELALLPFELSKVPPAFPGSAEGWLSLQNAAPVSITRTLRDVTGRGVVWPSAPRILFVAAQPQGMTVPLQPHVQALLAAIQPWLQPYDAGVPADLERAVGGHLTVLPRASIDEIERACAEHAFTHVHVLAHGVPHDGEEGHPFGVALHAGAGSDEIEVVTGRRFAAALRHAGDGGAPGLPCVVTLASCDSGNVGDVVYSGASFAHQLHQAGIPLVVASQYPLSFGGSVLMTETLYGRLLWGADPRRVLTDLRHKLYALHSARTHDWASLVAYAALPDDLTAQLERTRYVQARRSIEARLEWIDREIDRPDAEAPAALATIEGLLEKVDEAAARLPASGSYLTEITGLRGSTHKRKAQMLFAYALRLDRRVEDRDAGRRDQVLDVMWEELRRARRRYREASRHELAPPRGTELLFPTLLHWVLTQFLSLNAVLGRELSAHDWHAAVLSARSQLADGDGENRLWAHGSLAELYLLPLAHAADQRPVAADEALATIRHHAEELRELAPPAAAGEFSPTESTVRQFRRYSDWWGHPLFAAVAERHGVRREPWDRVEEAVRLVVDVLADA